MAKMIFDSTDRAPRAYARLNTIRRYCDEIRQASAAMLPEEPAGDDVPPPEISWDTVGELQRIERELREVADRLMKRGEHAPNATTECPF